MNKLDDKFKCYLKLKEYLKQMAPFERDCFLTALMMAYAFADRNNIIEDLLNKGFKAFQDYAETFRELAENENEVRA